MSTLKVLLVKVGQEPQVVEIENDLKHWQELVGGYVEIDNIGGGYHAVLNEDGISLGLPPNGCGYLGDYFFTKYGPRGKVTSLTDKDIASLKKFWMKYNNLPHLGDEITITKIDSTDDFFKIISEHRRIREQNFRTTQINPEDQ